MIISADFYSWQQFFIKILDYNFSKEKLEYILPEKCYSSG